MCCSDDPAAVGGALPSYVNRGIDGSTPIFAGANNDLGTSGLCIRTSDIPTDGKLLEPEAMNCPIPCNPTWDQATTDEVCGASRVCYQTQPLEPEDCILDPDTQQWRPVTGDDVGDGTIWATNSHATPDAVTPRVRTLRRTRSPAPNVQWQPIRTGS